MLSLNDNRVKVAYILTLMGSTLTLVAGLFFLILFSTFTAYVGHERLGNALMPLIPFISTALMPLMVFIMLLPGIIGFTASFLIRANHLLTGGILSIVAALISIPLILGTLFVGFLTLLIGGVLALTHS